MNKLRIIYDSNCESPREDEGKIGTIAYKSRNYKLGEEVISDPIDWLAEKIGWSLSRVYKLAKKNNWRYYSDEVKNYLEVIFFEKFIALPVYKYEHSGISIATSPFGCRWDSGQVGYIYTTKAVIKDIMCLSKVTKKDIEKAIASMEAEIKYFNEYIQGENFGFIVEDEDENELESCWGFIGDDFEKNGMIDNIDWEEYFPTLSKDEVVALLNETEKEYEHEY